MKTVLVTGGSGLVGSAIRKVTEGHTASFIFLDRTTANLLDWSETDILFERVRPNFVVHLAANVGGLYKNMNQKVQMLEDNILMNTHVLRAAHKYKVEKLVACLSTCIFPDDIEYPITECRLHDGPPHPSNAAYAHAKRLLDVQCRAYNEQYNCNFVTVIPTNIYGPHDNFNLEDSHVIPALIHKCHQAKRAGVDFVVRGSGKPLRQFIYSEDLARLILRVLFSDVKESIILSPSDEYSIREIATTIAGEYPVVFDTQWADGQYRKQVDNSRLLELFPDFEFTPLEVGLQRTIEWFNEESETIRR